MSKKGMPFTGRDINNGFMRATYYYQVVSCALTGLDGLPLEIEVSILAGLPQFEISGRGDPAIRESRGRVRAAVSNSGYRFPKGRVIASYAPAAMPKQGSAFDLPLALAILAASSQATRPADYPPSAYLGELSLDGRVKPVNGMLSRLLALREAGVRYVVGPRESEGEARLVDAIEYDGVGDLKEAVHRFSGIKNGRPLPENIRQEQTVTAAAGRSEQVLGQEEGLRACIIAAAGWHPLLMMGAPGCGKTLLASIVPGVLPPLGDREILEVLRVKCAAGKAGTLADLSLERPFRHTHHSITVSALVGGGTIPLAGECTLAHRGVLFLDEVTEMNPRVLDALREPVESQEIRLARAGWKMAFPADFLLVAACNPCRCGLLLEAGSRCRCQDSTIRRHLSRISGPLFDRFDLTAMLTRVEAASLMGKRDELRDRPDQDRIRADVAAAWQMQRKRAQALGPGPFHNSRVRTDKPLDYFRVGNSVRQFAAGLADASLMTARSFYSMIRVARTMADLERREWIIKEDIAEAFHYKAPMPWPVPVDQL